MWWTNSHSDFSSEKLRDKVKVNKQSLKNSDNIVRLVRWLATIMILTFCISRELVYIGISVRAFSEALVILGEVIL